MKMSEFRNKFRSVIEEFSRGLLVPGVLSIEKDRDIFKIPPQTDTGFGVELECMDYGVYPTAEGWRGGCWDITIWDLPDLEKGLKEFLNSIVQDAELEIFYSELKPYKWVLHYNFEGQRVLDETGRIFFNWLGHRSREIKCNASSP